MPAKPKAKAARTCDHAWHYDHIVYAASDTDGDCMIHRQCRKCFRHETAHVYPSLWHKMGRRELDPCLELRPATRRRKGGKK